jgi:hypothetical protein
LKVTKAVGLRFMSSIVLWKPSAIPLLRVKRHMATISSDQEDNVWPSLNQLRQTGLAQLVNGAQKLGTNCSHC